MGRIRKIFSRLVRQKWWAPAIGLLLGAVVLWRLNDSEAVETSRNELVARRDLKPGQAFGFSDFVLHRRPVRLSDPEVVTDQHLHLVSESAYIVPVAAGEALKFSALQSDRKVRRGIIKGNRAYTFRPESARLVRPGDRVDVLLRPRDSNLSASVIVSDVMVLEKLGNREGSEITISVPQRDLQLLEKALQQGKLNVALLGDKEPAGSVRRAPRSRGTHRRPSIEVIFE